MSNFWDLQNGKDDSIESNNLSTPLLSEYQQREDAKRKELASASQKLNQSQVTQAQANCQEPQITVNFSDNTISGSAATQPDASLYDITKAADDTTVPEIVISSQVNNAIEKQQADLYDPNSQFNSNAVDLPQNDNMPQKAYDGMQVSQSQDSFAIPSAPFVSSVDTSLFTTTPDMTSTAKQVTTPSITQDDSKQQYAPFQIPKDDLQQSIDESLYDITPPMTPTYAEPNVGDIDTTNSNDTQFASPNTGENGSFNIDNPMSMPDPSLSKITSPMTPTYSQSKVQSVPLSSVHIEDDGKFIISNPLQTPNPSISKTTSPMTPTYIEQNATGVGMHKTGNAQFASPNANSSDRFTIGNPMPIPDQSLLNTTSPMTQTTNPQSTNGMHLMEFDSTHGINTPRNKSAGGLSELTRTTPKKYITNGFDPKKIVTSVSTVAKKISDFSSKQHDVDITGVDFTRTLGTQLSQSNFIKDYKISTQANSDYPLAFENKAKMLLYLKNPNKDIQAAYVDVLNGLFDLNLSAQQYIDYFSRKSSSYSASIESAIKRVTNSDYERLKTKIGESSAEDITKRNFLSMLIHDAKLGAQQKDTVKASAEDAVKSYRGKAAEVVKKALSDSNIAKMFLTQLMLDGRDDSLSSLRIVLANELKSIAMYILLFGAKTTGNAMYKLAKEYSTDSEATDKVFGSLPYAMSEIYETVQAGDDAWIEGLRQKMVSQIQEHPSQFHVLTSMDIALPAANTLKQIANEGNPKNAFAVMQPITSATTMPFNNGSVNSPLNKDKTLKEIFQFKSKQVKSDAGKEIDEENKKLLNAMQNAQNKAASYASMLKATNITSSRPFLYESINDKSVFAEKINFAFDNIKSNRLTPDNLTPYVSVAFFKDNNWLVTKVPTMFMYAAVISADIEKDRDNPAATAVLTMSNTTGVLTDFTSNQQTTSYAGAGEKANMPGIFIEPGMNVQIRIGYTPYFSKMDVVFNGFVDGVQAGETLVVTASSFGAELLKPAYQGNERVGVMFYAHPRDMVVNALSHIKSYHLGANSFFDWVFYNKQQEKTVVDTWLDRMPIFSLVPHAFAQDPKYFQNIFAPDMYWPSGSITTAAGAGKFLDHVSLYWSRYTTAPGETAWKVIQDAVNRMPGFVAAVRNADERQTVFFGRPEYPYRYTYHPSLYELGKTPNGVEMYKQSVAAAASKDKIKYLYNSFNDDYTYYSRNYESAFSNYREQQSPNTAEKDVANGFARNILSGNRTFSGVISGRWPILGGLKYRPAVKESTSSALLNGQLKLINDDIKQTAANTINNVQNVLSGDELQQTVSYINSMKLTMLKVYGSNLSSAIANFINTKKGDTIDPQVISNMTMAFDDHMLNDYKSKLYQIESAAYNSTHIADFHTRMTISREMYKAAANTDKRDVEYGVPWQLAPYTGKIPATIDGSTMFRRYWVAHSSLNLLTNDVHTDPQSIATSVTCFGPSVYTGWDWSTILISRLIKFIMSGQNSIPEEVATINGQKVYGFKVSANKYIIPEDRRDETYVDENANMPQIRAYVAASVLADKLMRGYNGSFTIAGNHLIEPFDSVLLDDEQTNMHGLVDVRKVMIHISRETGLVTRVVPDMKVGIRNLTISPATTAVSVLSNLALFTLETVGVAAVTLGTGGLGLPIAALGALSVHGTIKKIIQSFLPPITMSNTNSFVRDTSMDTSKETIQENGITSSGMIEWKFDNAMMLYPIFIGDSYYMPRLRGYNYRDKQYWDDVFYSWKRYWQEVGYGFKNTLKYLNLSLSTDADVFNSTVNSLKAQSNFSQGYLNLAQEASEQIGGN